MLALGVLGILFGTTSCKKCYVCTDTCYTCKLIQADTLADTQTGCSSDSTWSKSAQATWEGKGYTCTSAAGNYRDEYCSNSEGESYYLDYHGKDRYNCVKK